MPLAFLATGIGIGLGTGTGTGTDATGTTARGQQIDDVGGVEAHGLSSLQMHPVGAVAKHVPDGPVLGPVGEGGQGRVAAVQAAQAVGVVQPPRVDPGVARQVEPGRVGTVGLGGAVVVSRSSAGPGDGVGSVGIPRQVDRPHDDAAAPVARPGQGEPHVDGLGIGSRRRRRRRRCCLWAHRIRISSMLSWCLCT